MKKEEFKERRNLRERPSYNRSTVNDDSFLENNIKPFVRGEYSLPFSYWYIGFLVTVIVNLPLIIIEAQKVEPEGSAHCFTLFI